MESGTTDWGIIGFAVSVFTLAFTIIGLYLASKQGRKDR